MAHVVYVGVRTASMVSGLSNKLMFSSVELAVHAAATALRALRPASSETAAGPSVTENPLIRDELESMDIEAKLRTVHALVLTIQKQRGVGGEGTAPAEVDDSDVVGVCLDQVKEVLESITVTVNSLNEELEEHDQRWFSTWRTPDTKHHVIALRAKILILDKRVDMLLKVKTFVGGAGGELASTSAKHNNHTLSYGNDHHHQLLSM